MPALSCKERIEWIDTVKGIGIILVILGHSAIHPNLHSLIYSFHIPLFFFISGFLFSAKNQTFSSFVQKQANRLLVPYLFFSIISLVFWLFVYLITNQEDIKYLWKPVLATIYGNHINNWLFHNGTLWFLPCLFITSIVYFFLSEKIHNNIFIIIVLFVFTLIGYAQSNLWNKPLPFGVNTSLVSLFFYGLGNLLKKKIMTIDETNFNIYLFICIFFISLIFLASQNNNIREDGVYVNSVMMSRNLYGNYFYFYLSSLSGILLAIFVSMRLQRNRMLKFIGKHSLCIFLTHLLMFKIIYLFIAFSFNLSLPNNYVRLLDTGINYQFIVAFIYLFFSLMGSALFSIFLNRYFPRTVGVYKKN